MAIWHVLNRLRSGVGRSKSNLKWRYIEDDVYECGATQTMPQLACEYFKSRRTLYSERWSDGTSQVLEPRVILGLPDTRKKYCNTDREGKALETIVSL